MTSDQINEWRTVLERRFSGKNGSFATESIQITQMLVLLEIAEQLAIMNEGNGCPTEKP